MAALRTPELMLLKIIHSVTAMVVLEVNVEVDGVYRNSVCPKTIGNFHDSCLGIVAKARLLESKRPKRRKVEGP
jgi:hypothetical protein